MMNSLTTPSRMLGSWRSVALATALAWTQLVACGDGAAAESEDDGPVSDPDDPCVPGPNPSVEIGQGEYAFAPCDDGDMLELIHGPQGGYHTLMALHASDIDGSEDLDAVWRGYVGDEQLGGSYPFLDFRCANDEGLQVWNVYLFWEAQPEDLHMQPVHIEVEFTDASGSVMTASKDAVIFDPNL
jgi:hypothetical protein